MVAPSGKTSHRLSYFGTVVCTGLQLGIWGLAFNGLFYNSGSLAILWAGPILVLVMIAQGILAYRSYRLHQNRRDLTVFLGLLLLWAGLFLFAAFFPGKLAHASLSIPGERPSAVQRRLPATSPKKILRLTGRVWLLQTVRNLY
jgi:hypothetical protein